jgi:hypothetical protein
MNLSDKAMLVKLSISQWTARRLDVKATREVIENYSAKPDAGRFNKLLVDVCAVKRYQKAANEARIFHYKNTLPWGDDESRILPAANYSIYSAKMREFRAKFEGAVDEFVSEYPGLIEQAQRDLNGLFRAEDYPSAEALRFKFRFDFSVKPVDDSKDFRVSLAADEVERIRAEIEGRVSVSVNDAMADCWARLYEAVKHLADKLREPDAIFRDSLVGNIAELCDILPRLNVTEDPSLTAVLDEARASLASLDPDRLRKYELDRKSAAGRADDILSRMAGYVGK